IAQGATAWKDLFNGKDLTGWSTGTAGWKVENGVIVGGQGGGRGSLVSTDRYKDFELEFDFMLAEQPAAPDGACSMCTHNSDATDNRHDPSEAAWKEAGPISFQWRPAGVAGGFAGFVKFRNARIREL